MAIIIDENKKKKGKKNKKGGLALAPPGTAQRIGKLGGIAPHKLRDGIHDKIKAQIDKEFRMRVLDKVYTRTRQRLRQKGGMIAHDAAMRAVIVEDGQKILDEILNEAIDELGKFNPVLAENLRSKDEKPRNDAERVLHMMTEAAENPN